MLSLNEIYEKESFMYWCNAMGEINNPYDTTCSPDAMTDITVMPPREQELYGMKQSDGQEYVVSWNYRAYIAYTALFDYEYLMDVMPDNTDEERVNALEAYAESLTCPGCEILYGENTDPDGHEIILMIPYDKRGIKDDLIKTFDKTIYSSFEQFVAPKPEPSASPNSLYLLTLIRETAAEHECLTMPYALYEDLSSAVESAKEQMRLYRENNKDLRRFMPTEDLPYPMYGSVVESEEDSSDPENRLSHEFFRQISWGCGWDYTRYAVVVDKVTKGV